MIELDELLALETRVWQALVDGDAAADTQLLSDDFVGLYPSGFAGRDEHVAQLASGPTVRRFELTQARVVVVAESALLLCYRAEYERASDDAVTEAMFVSSLWCRRGDDWVNVFSQDTPDTGLAVV